ncbi:MAG: response regulator [Patescibacteria group bacterium]|nr:response regulator [Patescibacteria group bacterium]
MGKVANRNKILVVDDEETILQLIKTALSKEFDVITVGSREEADKKILKYYRQFRVVLIDIHLSGFSGPVDNVNALPGFILASWYQELDPQMGIILMSGYPYVFGSTTMNADDCLLKPISLTQLTLAVKNVIYKKTMPHSIRRRRFELLSNLPGKNSVKLISREAVGGNDSGAVEALNGECSDKKKIKWVVYSLPEQEKNTFTIGVASTIGCGKGCGFCSSGTRKFDRKLSVDEIICQVLHGFNSIHARGIFEKKGVLKPYVNFTCEGDALVSNLPNTVRAIELLSDVDVGELEINFIITSIGDEKNLDEYFTKYLYLPRVRHYWSVNSLAKKTRSELMPFTRRHSLEKIRDLYQEIAKKTGKDVTASWILIKNKNDAEKDMDEIVEFFGNRPFQIKIQPFVGKDIPKFFQTKEKDLEKFKSGLEERGMICRIRNIIGTEILAGCGTTVPTGRSALFLDNAKS